MAKKQPLLKETLNSFRLVMLHCCYAVHVTSEQQMDSVHITLSSEVAVQMVHLVKVPLQLKLLDLYPFERHIFVSYTS